MFQICNAMNWAHLPVAGGIYAQHPDFLEKMMIIWTEQSKYEDQKKNEEKNKTQSMMGRGQPRMRPSRHHR